MKGCHAWPPMPCSPAPPPRGERRRFFRSGTRSSVGPRRACGKSRHPVQVVLTHTGDLPIEHGLMFTTPALPVIVIAGSAAINGLRIRLGDRPWVEVIDGGQPVSLAAALGQLYDGGLEVIS